LPTLACQCESYHHFALTTTTGRGALRVRGWFDGTRPRRWYFQFDIGIGSRVRDAREGCCPYRERSRGGFRRATGRRRARPERRELLNEHRKHHPDHKPLHGMRKRDVLLVEEDRQVRDVLRLIFDARATSACSPTTGGRAQDVPRVAAATDHRRPRNADNEGPAAVLVLLEGEG